MPLDISRALLLGQLINASYASGTAIPPVYTLPALGFTLVDAIYGNDLATEIGGAKLPVPFGYICKNPANDYVIVIRGTMGIWEWIQDARFLRIACPLAIGAGETEDGFTGVYLSMTASSPTGPLLLPYVKSLAASMNSLTITGHSLGSALVTLLAYDLAVNAVISPSVVTFASPQVGNLIFADSYNNEVPDTYRISNVPDIVPGLPGPLLGYDHVDQLVRVNSIGKAKILPACSHAMDTYMYLLDQMRGGNTFQIDASCAGWQPW